MLEAVLVDWDLVDCHRDLDVQLEEVAEEHVHEQDEGPATGFSEA